MLDPRNSHVDNSNFQLLDPFRSMNSSHLLPDKAKRQTPERHDDWIEGEVDLKLLESEKKEEDSGIHSPPLWKNNNNNSPIMHHHHPLSPNSRRREAIVRGQRELMDMVKNLPESCYELSLKDLVEHIPRAAQNQQECLLQQEDDDDDDDDHDQIQTQSNRQGSKKFDKKRGYSVENNNKGMFLKMAFPVGNRTRKSIVLLNSSSSNSKGSSKLLDGNGKTSKSSGDTDKYWWKKRFSMSSESDSSRSSSHGRSITSSSSSSRSSTSTRERRTMLPNFMTCFQSSKNQAAE